MKKIIRYELDVSSVDNKQRLKIKIPFNSELLKGITMFNGIPFITAIVEDGNYNMDRSFVFVAENDALPARCNMTNHIGEFEAKAEVGKVILHVFEDT